MYASEAENSNNENLYLLSGSHFALLYQKSNSTDHQHQTDNYMAVYFNSDYKRIEYDEQHRVLVATWKLAPTSTEFRSGMMAMLDAMKQFNTGRLVYNVIPLGLLLEEDSIWAATEWREKAIALGRSKVAFVLPDDVFTMMSVESMMEREDREVPIAYFKRMEDAIRWVVIPRIKLENKREPFKSHWPSRSIL